MFLVNDEAETYAKAHTSAVHPVYHELREVTHEQTSAPQMQVGKLEGRFLKMLAQLCNARLAVEIGTFTGYSALCIAEGMAPDGRLITCDVNEVTTALARSFWAKVPWGDKIESRLGPALETLRDIDGPIDLAFIDADKTNYTAYWEALLPKMRPGGLVVVDNVLWSGRVLDPQEESDHAIAALNEHALQDTRVEVVMLTVRDGMLLGRVR